MTLRCEHHRERHEALRARRRELAGNEVRYAYRLLAVLFQREGWELKARRVYRLHVEEGLKVRTRWRNERAQPERLPLSQAVCPNEKWTMKLLRSMRKFCNGFCFIQLHQTFSVIL